jgi:hypothetical protein
VRSGTRRLRVCAADLSYPIVKNATIDMTVKNPIRMKYMLIPLLMAMPPFLSLRIFISRSLLGYETYLSDKCADMSDKSFI